MIKDYSGGVIMVNSRNRIRHSRKKSSVAVKDIFPATNIMWKAVGAMLLVTLVLGISSTIWYGLQIQVALDQIGSNREINSTLQNENRLLTVQHDFMLTSSNIAAAAKKIGLQPPSDNQLRYP